MLRLVQTRFSETGWSPLAFALGWGLGCAATRPNLPEVPALNPNDGEVHIFSKSPGLSKFATIIARKGESDGDTRLEVVPPRPDQPRDRLVAWGQVTAGRFQGLSLIAAGTSTSTPPFSIDVPFVVRPGESTLVRLSLQRNTTVEATTGLPAVLPALGFCAAERMHAVSVFDRRTREVVAMIPVGGAPGGLAVDLEGRQLFVAVPSRDAVAVIDLARLAITHQLSLRAGDRPEELTWTPGSIVVVNGGSRSVAFVDPESGVELQRLIVGDSPRRMVVDRSRNRGFVLGQGSNDLTEIDLANRTSGRRIDLESSPQAIALDERRQALYVVHAGSPYVLELNAQNFAITRRVFVGLGLSSIAVAAETGLAFIGTNDGRVLALEPTSNLPFEAVRVSGALGALAIDPIANELLLSMSEADQLGFLELSDRRTLESMDVGFGPARLALP